MTWVLVVAGELDAVAAAVVDGVVGDRVAAAPGADAGGVGGGVVAVVDDVVADGVAVADEQDAVAGAVGDRRCW